MTLFRKEEEWFTFYDGEGNKIERKTEVRFDPLTGESSRLVFDPGMDLTPPDYTEAAVQTSGENCPFCPENVYKLTPVFPKEIAHDGRISVGESVVFPNLFPYSKHNGVVVFSEDHYVRLADFTVSMLKDAFVAAQNYVQQVMTVENKPLHASINWNYLPCSGGSILHPHLHVVISESATNQQALIEQRGKEFKATHNKEFFSHLYDTEKKDGARWIGEHGNVGWIHAYAPKAHNDFLAIFSEKTSIQDITEQDWENFAQGLQAVFATLTEQGLASFNLMLNISNDTAPIHARLVPRLTLGGLDTSDMNFFQMLHGEPLTYKIPEDIAGKARAHF